jgi:heme iron utilization protein
MKSRIDTTLELLHTASEAALATFSVKLPGYPFASQVAFALDEHHHPILLVSGLAEHSKNLAANPRASLLISRTLADGEIARVTLTGEIHSFQPEASLIDRYLRYQPAAERFLQLGDFGFRRFEIHRIYIVGGFGQAGWLEEKHFTSLSIVSPDAEQLLINAAQHTLPAAVHLLGVDAYGVDILMKTQRLRIALPAGPVTSETLHAALQSMPY